MALAFCAWIIQSSRYMSLLNVNNVSLMKFVEFTSYLSVDIVAVILPLSFAVSSAFVYHRFNESNQLTALQAGGIHPAKMLAPLLSLATIFVCYLYASNACFSPFSWIAFREMEFNIKNSIDPPESSGSIFSSNGFSVYAQRYMGNFLFENIYIVDSRTPRKISTYYAKSGTIVNNTLVLSNGEQIEIDEVSKKKSLTKFQTYQYNLNEILNNIRGIAQPNEKFMDELLMDTGDAKKNLSQVALFHQKITSPLLTFVFALLAFCIVLLSSYRKKSSYMKIFILLSSVIFIQGTYFWIANASAKNATFIMFNYGFVAFLLIVSSLMTFLRYRT
jgi:lipopolysaccharide export system permease protein